MHMYAMYAILISHKVTNFIVYTYIFKVWYVTNFIVYIFIFKVGYVI